VTRSDIKNTLIDLGADKKKISIIPAFLPPNKSLDSIGKLPKIIYEFIKVHRPLISTYAYNIKTQSLDIKKTKTLDLYGIDLIVDLCIALKKRYPRIGIVLCITHINDEYYYRKIKNIINNNNISNNILIYNKPAEDLHNLWLKSDIYIRPTLSDGDSVALREAIWLKTPSIASDAAPRPEGTIIFKNRNIYDLTNKTNNVLDNYGYYLSRVKSLKTENNYIKILNIYKMLEE